MDTKQVIARFEAERQALALMDHPNIASVLDAGSTEAGRPYFVMELVRGVPITEYCDTNELGLEERLELFVDVCGAVQHAHQKGIIHRDLKPSNILVTVHDVRAVPKVIDFGIAKATTQRLTEKTLFTEFRQMIGTPQYMSPEQAEMSGLDVDTRSDIYSLGAVLYELLTGATPFEAAALMAEGYAGMSQKIREVDPPSLSQRFTALGEERTTVAKRRGAEPERWSDSLSGDLQWIVSKALEKDRTRRYETAIQLADDVTHFLASEPILAVPPSPAYRLKKFVRRNRVWVATGTLVACALAVGLAAATFGWAKANRELDRSRAMSEFLQELHIGFDPVRQSENTDVETIVSRCEELFGEDHAAIGSLLFTRASLLQSWGRLDEARAVLERSLEFQQRTLGNDHEALAATYKGLGRVHTQLGNAVEARAALEEALRIHLARFGRESLQTGESAKTLGQFLMEAGNPEDNERIEECLLLAVEACRASVGEHDVRTVRALCTYGLWLQSVQRLDECISTLEEAVEAGREHRQVIGDLWIASLNALAVGYIMNDENDKAAVYYAGVIDILRERGMSGTTFVTQLMRYGAWLVGVKRMETAEEIFREGVAVANRDLRLTDESRREALRALVRLLGITENKAAQAEAESLLRRRITDIAELHGTNSAAHGLARSDFGEWLQKAGREQEAEEYLGKPDVPEDAPTETDAPVDPNAVKPETPQ